MDFWTPEETWEVEFQFVNQSPAEKVAGELLQALEDIINAAGNNEPYSARELENIYIDLVDRAKGDK